ncbi:MAG: phage tail assembly protein [Salinisphaera sp.]|jgi:hypothetical protein|nr:phage tail assembly protein [Salinisphaera sp.]
MSDTNTSIELSRPLDIDGAAVSSLSMREPTVDDQIVASEMKGSAAIQEVHMIANLCDVAPADIRSLSLRDYRKLQEAFVGFTD